MGERGIELEIHSIRTQHWIVISMYGLAKCTEQKLSNSAFYMKEVLQPTWGELQYSYYQQFSGLDHLFGIRRTAQDFRNWRLQTSPHLGPVCRAIIIHCTVSECRPTNPVI